MVKKLVIDWVYMGELADDEDPSGTFITYDDYQKLEAELSNVKTLYAKSLHLAATRLAINVGLVEALEKALVMAEAYISEAGATGFILAEYNKLQAALQKAKEIDGG